MERMRAKSEIERTLEHLKAGDCAADPAVNAIWITALEWVLGDEDHRKAYDEWLKAIKPPEQITDCTTVELQLNYWLTMAYNRLR
jgi:hypothetical protein